MTPGDVLALCPDYWLQRIRLSTARRVRLTIATCFCQLDTSASANRHCYGGEGTTSNPGGNHGTVGRGLVSIYSHFPCPPRLEDIMRLSLY